MYNQSQEDESLGKGMVMTGNGKKTIKQEFDIGQNSVCLFLQNAFKFVFDSQTLSAINDASQKHIKIEVDSR